MAATSDISLRNPPRRPIGAWAAVTLIASVTICATLCLAQSLKHTFFHKEVWLTSKTYLERGAIGGAMFRITRVPLARDVAHLGAWFGFHEILWHEDLPLASLEFSFRLDDAAWLAVLFNGADHDFEAVRISRDPRLPPCACHVDRKRLFSDYAPVTHPHDPGPGWHHAKLELRNGGYRLSIDERVFDERALDARAVQRIGFKAGGASAWVDDVVMRCTDGTERRESFANTRNLTRNAIAITLAVLILHLSIAWWIRRPRFHRPVVIYHVAAGFLTCVAATSLCALDRVWLSSRYPKNVLTTPLYRNTIVFEPDPIPAPVVDPESAPYRIMFIGSSQTWGSGATILADMWTRVLEARLNATPGRSRRVECINTGINGAVSAELLERYRTEWIDTPIDLTVINLSHNDKDTDELRRNLTAFAELNREAGIATVFLLEPNSHQPCTFNRVHPPNVRRNHAMIRELSTRLGLPCIDMQSKMDADRDRGFLWWDIVHLTSAGQAVFAENLREDLLPLIPTR